jgi:DNA modification methylase
VNVANLGRRPYRSLSADVVGILQDDLRLLLRGEIVWVKQRGSSGSCAWGSFQRPGNPVLRDLTERVVIASKGRFDRALSAKERAGRGLPSESSMTREDFMENTLDVWEIPAESATRVGHRSRSSSRPA